MPNTKKYTELTLLILQAVSVEKIFLLATTKCQYETESIFFDSPIKKNSPIPHHYLLVLIPKEFNIISYAEVQEQIERLCETDSPVTILAMEMEIFNNWLQEGHPFAVSVKSNALLIYDRGIIMMQNHKPIDKASVIRTNRIYYKEGIHQIKEFLKAGDLPQATIIGMKTLIKTSIGIDLQTQDPDKLIRYCRMVFRESSWLFPANIEKINALLEYLEIANSGYLPANIH